MKSASAKKYIVSSFIVIALAIGSYSVYAYLLREKSAIQKVDSIKALQVLLAADSWSVPKPPRTDWTVGTILLVEGDRIDIFKAGEKAFPEKEISRVTGKAKYPTVEVSLDCSIDSNLQFLSGKNKIATESVSKSKFSLTLEGTSTELLEIDGLEKSINNNRDLQNAISGHPPASLFVINEVLMASSIRIAKMANSQFSANERAALNDTLKGGLKTNIKEDSSSDYIVTGPIVIGYKARVLKAVAKTLGNPKNGIKIEIGDQNLLDQSKLGDLEQASIPEKISSQNVATPIHVLAIGLDLYPVNQKAMIGGVLPGAPVSASLVASRMKQLIGHNSNCSVELFAPTLDKGCLRERTSKETLAKYIADWKRRADAHGVEIGNGGPAIYMVYYCGHGISNSTDGFSYVIPEVIGEPDRNGRLQEAIRLADFALTSDVRSSYVLILDCCREEDGLLKEAMKIRPNPFSPRLRSDDIISMRMSLNDSFPPSGTLIVNAVQADKPAETVDYQIGINRCKIGPMAAVLDTEFKMQFGSKQNYSLAQFVQLLLKEVEIGGAKWKGLPSTNRWTTNTMVRFSGVQMFKGSK